jgi:hypothetical protein
MTSHLFTTDQFIKPAYGSGSFAEIPDLLRAVLIGGAAPALRPQGWASRPQRHQNVIVLFVDACGWHAFERFQDHPLFQRFIQRGSVNCLTSQFPSTTSAHVTTLYTGQPVGQHGVFEWFYYEPVVDAMIAPLLFSFAGDEERETLAVTGVQGAQILPSGHFASQLTRAGVKLVAFQPREVARSTYSKTMMAGAQMIGYSTLAEGMTNLTLALHRATTPACCIFYTGDFDGICHGYGPDSAQSDAELDAILTLLERWLARDIAGRFPDTLLMLIADHGQTALTPDTTFYINQAPIFERLRPLLRTNRHGQILAPGGSPRDLFLYVQEDHLAEAQALLAQALAGRADVLPVADLVREGFFGPTPVSDAFASRAGNLVILPHLGEGVYWYEKDRFVQKYRGHHGGLTRAEMEIPLLLTLV